MIAAVASIISGGRAARFAIAQCVETRRAKPSSAFDTEEPQLSPAGAERPGPRVGEHDLPLSARRPARRMAAHDRRDTRRPDNATTRQIVRIVQPEVRPACRSRRVRATFRHGSTRSVRPAARRGAPCSPSGSRRAGVDDRPGPRLLDRQREHRLRHAGDRLPRRASSVAMSCACNVKVVVSMACYSIAANVSRAVRASA